MDEDKEEKRNPQKIISQKRTRATHFINLKITEPHTLDRFSFVQQKISSLESFNSNVSKSFIQIPKIHISILVLSLDGESELEKAMSSFKIACDQIRQTLSQFKTLPSIRLQGVSSFSRRVLYAKVFDEINNETSEQFSLNQHIHSIFRKHFQEGQIKIMSETEFTPHATILKFSGGGNKRFKVFRGGKKGKQGKWHHNARNPNESTKDFEKDIFDSELVESDFLFGSQPIAKLDFCSIGSQTNEDGSHHSLFSVSFK